MARRAKKPVKIPCVSIKVTGYGKKDESWLKEKLTRKAVKYMRKLRGK